MHTTISPICSSSNDGVTGSDENEEELIGYFDDDYNVMEDEEEMEEDEGMEELEEGMKEQEEEIMHVAPIDESVGEECDNGNDYSDPYRIDSFTNIGLIDFLTLGDDDVIKFHFLDRGIASDFYNAFAKSRGFSGRKSKCKRNRRSELVRQNLVCSCEGFRPEKYKNLPNRQKEPRVETRCGCTAMMQIRFDSCSDRWIVKSFSNNHNHEMMYLRFYGMLHAHRKMTEADVGQMNSMRNGGISTTKIYGLLASQSGGYQHVGFGRRDMYNNLAKQRRQLAGDATSAVAFLREMAATDPCLFFYKKS